MNQTHEYSMIGHSRATVGRWLGIVASLIAAGCITLIGFAIVKAADLGWMDPRPYPYSVPVTATVIYGIAFFVFNKWLWRRKCLQRFMSIPDLSGRWKCAGVTLDNISNEPTFQWEAEVTISQTWEKIKVHSATNQSRSNSVAASIVKDEGVGFVLMYSYRNEPRPGTDMKAHIGYCELHITEDLSSANGHYFNSGGRLTHGTMELTREENGR
jgi:hypothetical protein